ncbi:PH domain-containing protein [Limibaculum sp. FT325]|uniref:photosynthetic complex putative assembly protein PuhB n=1 Tax=Thermohalobaculum sediminis TaxID=2939436 RepID=UPI00201C944C|nr:photosynthetic complex putative assembly protein PuhB [Limibaculum sediminis]MCL5778604.1 PH domain-containing protein [Limibaculum sediminis]
MSHDDFAFEPVRGLPGLLPRGERVLWQGAPAWRPLARRAFHTRAVAVWFGAIVAFRLGQALTGTMTPGDAALSIAMTAGVGAVGVGILAALAWGYGRTTVYTITNRRVVIRFGLALDMSINLPFRQIASAAARQFPDGTCDLPLRLAGKDRLAYLHLWPNVRPWRFRDPEPMLRAVPEGEKVAAILADALRAHAEASARGEEPAAEPRPAREPRAAGTPMPAGHLAAAG